MSAYWQRLWRLALVEWELREQSSFTGLLWTLLHPALMFSILYLLFTKWMGKHAPEYHFYLLIGLLQWNFFSACTAYSLSSLVRRAALLRNFPMPLEVPVFAAALSEIAAHALEMGLLLALIAYGHRPSARWLLLLPIEAGLIVLSVGVAMILAWMQVLYRDVERIWAILTTAGFFLTPVFYSLEVIALEWRAWLEFNPIYVLIEASRAVLLSRGAPWTRLLPVYLLAAGLAAVGLSMLRWRAGPARDCLF